MWAARATSLEANGISRTLTAIPPSYTSASSTLKFLKNARKGFGRGCSAVAILAASGATRDWNRIENGQRGGADLLRWYFGIWWGTCQFVKAVTPLIKQKHKTQCHEEGDYLWSPVSVPDCECVCKIAEGATLLVWCWFLTCEHWSLFDMWPGMPRPTNPVILFVPRSYLTQLFQEQHAFSLCSLALIQEQQGSQNQVSSAAAAAWNKTSLMQEFFLHSSTCWVPA